MKRILITGGNGFIGSFLVEEAIKRGYEVYAGVRGTSNLEHLTKATVQYFIADLSDKAAIKQSLEKIEGFDFVIQAAGITKTCNTKDFESSNYQNTKNLMEALQEADKIPTKFIYISSLAAQGPSKKAEAPAQLTDTPRPVSVYGKSKLKTENYIKSLDNFPYLIFRPTGVYGPREKDYFVMYKSINSGMETYIGTKKQLLSFIYVKDLATLFLDTLPTSFVNKTYLISDLHAYTAGEFNEIVRKTLGKRTLKIVVPKFVVKMIAVIGEKFMCTFFKKIPTVNIDKYKDISQNNWMCDSTDLVEDFNFAPKYDLQKGVEEAIAWYKEKKLL